ncbi:MAG: hypothetical protein ACRC2V_09940 [Xenococcaceae cyanobacterium]
MAEILLTLPQQIFTALDGGRFQVFYQLALAEYFLDGSTLQSLY